MSPDFIWVQTTVGFGGGVEITQIGDLFSLTNSRKFRYMCGGQSGSGLNTVLLFSQQMSIPRFTPIILLRPDSLLWRMNTMANELGSLSRIEHPVTQALSHWQLSPSYVTSSQYGQQIPRISISSGPCGSDKTRTEMGRHQNPGGGDSCHTDGLGIISSKINWRSGRVVCQSDKNGGRCQWTSHPTITLDREDSGLAWVCTDGRSALRMGSRERWHFEACCGRTGAKMWPGYREDGHLPADAVQKPMGFPHSQQSLESEEERWPKKLNCWKIRSTLIQIWILSLRINMRGTLLWSFSPQNLSIMDLTYWNQFNLRSCWSCNSQNFHIQD
jgi:hypothetical protein